MVKNTNTTEMQKIIDDLRGMGDELDNIQNKMAKHLALRVALLEKITELAKNEEKEIVFEKTKKIRLRRRKALD